MTDLWHDPGFVAWLTGSYVRRLGTPLVPEGTDAARLYGQAPFAVRAHDGGADPRFVYANRAAQIGFGYSRTDLIGLPSRLSAEAPERAERQFDAVARDGVSRNYRGLPIARDGRRVWIERAVVWQLDRDGATIGQAATFSEWRDA